MSYLIDSDWIVDYLLERHEAVKLLGDLQRRGIAISVVTHMEIFEGIAGSADPRRSTGVPSDAASNPHPRRQPPDR